MLCLVGPKSPRPHFQSGSLELRSTFQECRPRFTSACARFETSHFVTCRRRKRGCASQTNGKCRSVGQMRFPDAGLGLESLLSRLCRCWKGLQGPGREPSTADSLSGGQELGGLLTAPLELRPG